MSTYFNNLAFCPNSQKVEWGNTGLRGSCCAILQVWVGTGANLWILLVDVPLIHPPTKHDMTNSVIESKLKLSKKIAFGQLMRLGSNQAGDTKSGFSEVQIRRLIISSEMQTEQISP
jgi:hypothetical protein